MKTVEIHSKGSVGYEEAMSFARRIYRDRLSATLTASHEPDVMFAVREGGRMTACMGINRTIHNGMIRGDSRVRFALRTVDHGAAEQSILAIEQCSVALVSLVSLVAQYARTVGFSTIVFMGIAVSLKTIERLGLNLRILGPVDRSLIPAGHEHIYDQWLRDHDPQVCVVDTGSAGIASNLFRKLANKFVIGPELIRALGPEAALHHLPVAA